MLSFVVTESIIYFEILQDAQDAAELFGAN
jgi:hypothetical protein